jgi:hypothetical protein
MEDSKKIVFYIDVYSPETIPMGKLAEYMGDFAAILGKEHGVHFDHLETGSTKIVSRIDFEDAPKVTSRLRDISRGNLTKETAKIVNAIDDRLANDNAIGRVFELKDDGQPVAEILAFEGRTRIRPPSYGPFTQEGHLDGVLISVGGKDETISIRLQNGELIYSNCETTRAIARELGKHLFEPIRIHGTGRWTREPDGRWDLRNFRVQSFTTLEDGSLRDTVAALRAVQGNGWKDLQDPLAELDDLRRDKDELH